MNGTQIAHIFNSFPRVSKHLTKYFEEGIKLTGKEEMDVHLGPMKRNPEIAAKIVLSMGPPRFLYEYFDEQKIYCSIRVFPPDNKMNRPDALFEAYVDGEAVFIGANREDSENQCFVKAFEKFEKKLEADEQKL